MFFARCIIQLKHNPNNYKRISSNKSLRKLSSIRDTFVPTRKRWCLIRPIVDDNVDDNDTVIYGRDGVESDLSCRCKREAIEWPSGPVSID